MNNQPNYDLVKKAVNDLIISIEKRKRKENGSDIYAWPFRIIHAKERLCG